MDEVTEAVKVNNVMRNILKVKCSLKACEFVVNSDAVVELSGEIELGFGVGVHQSPVVEVVELGILRPDTLAFRCLFVNFGKRFKHLIEHVILGVGIFAALEVPDALLSNLHITEFLDMAALGLGLDEFELFLNSNLGLLVGVFHPVDRVFITKASSNVLATSNSIRTAVSSV